MLCFPALILAQHPSALISSNLPDSVSACDSVQICVDAIAGGSYAWNTSNISSPVSPTIGDFYQGGKVFWIDPNDNTLGMVCDTSNLSNYVEWGCSGNSINTNTSIGSGFQNTLNIINSCPQSGIAAELCYNSINNGYSDWYLPSKDELNEIYINRNLLGMSSNQWNFAHWSSSDFYGNGNNPYGWPNDEVAWGQQFSSSWQGGYLKVGFTQSNGDSDGYVLAVRSYSTLNPIIPTNCVWVSNTGWNYITVTTANGITATDSVYVSLNTQVSGSSSVSACDTYTWEGQTITSSGNLTHTYQSALGCDSVHTLSVTINNSTSNTTTVTECDSYTWPVNGTAYTQSGTYTDVSTNALGCTHTETLVLIINNSTSNTTTVTDCDSYTWPVNGTAYNSSGTYTDISTNASGCTHTETLVLVIDSLTNSVSICFGESITVGSNTYTQTGIYNDIFTSVNGCDSIVITELVVSPQINVIISQIGFDIKANTPAGSMPYVYEWNTGEISGQITPSAGGEYWVIVTDANGCISDTSFFDVDWIEPTLIEDFNIDRLSIYPNPSRDIFNIEFTSLLRQNLEIRIINSIGEIIYLENLENYTGEYSKAINLKEYSKAFYFLEIITNGGIINKKLILQ